MVLEINEELKTGIIERLIPEEQMRAVRTFDPEIRRRVKRLRLIDDTLFTVVAKDKEAVQEMLRTVMLDEKLVVQEVQTQYALPNLRGRGVRLDAHCILGDGRRCNIEVQKADNDDHARRVRYNASCITASCTDTGTKFEKIPDVCIVYISTFDIFGLGKMYYEERSVLLGGTEADDKCHDGIVDNGYAAIYVNTKIKDEKLPKLTKLMELFMKEQADDEDFIDFPEISREISYYKNSEKGETDMCDIIEEYAEKREARGEAKGEANAMRGVVGKFLKSGKDIAYIAEFLELPLSEVEKYAAELSAR